MTIKLTVDVLEKESDHNIGPVIVAYRRMVKPNGQWSPLTKDDEYPIHIKDILEMTVNYSLYM